MSVKVILNPVMEVPLGTPTLPIVGKRSIHTYIEMYERRFFKLESNSQLSIDYELSMEEVEKVRRPCRRYVNFIPSLV